VPNQPVNLTEPLPPAGAAPTDTYELLIASARTLFARGGYDGTSIRAITSAAGANLGAVTYHFGSKQALYEAVLRRVIDHLPERIDRALSLPGTPLDRLEAVVRVAFEQLHDHPDQPFFILQEIAAGKPPPAPVLEVMKATAARVSKVVQEGQRDGSVRPGDPFLMFLSLMAQPVYMSFASRAFTGVAGGAWHDPAFHAGVVQHATMFARRGLAAESVTDEGRSP